MQPEDGNNTQIQNIEGGSIDTNGNDVPFVRLPTEEAQQIHETLNIAEKQRSSVMVRSDSGKLLMDGKRYQMTDHISDGIVELNQKSNYKLSQSFMSEYNFFKEPKHPTSLGIRYATQKAKKRSRDLNQDLSQSSKDYYVLFNKWRKNDLLRSAMAGFGLLVVVVNFEYDTRTYKEIIDRKKFPNLLLHPRHIDQFGIVCKMLILISTMITLYFSLCSRKYKIELLSKYFTVDLPGASSIPQVHVDDEKVVEQRQADRLNAEVNKLKKKAYNSNYVQGYKVWNTQFVIELMALAVIPIPYYDTYFADGSSTHLLSELLMIAMFLRLYFILRTCLHFCEYADAFSMKISKSLGFESTGVSFSIKCLYITEPAFTLSTMFIGTILTFSYIIRIAEIEHFRVAGGSIMDSYFTSMYFTSVTLSTVGYGDICPGTKLGQTLTIIFVMWGTLLLSVVVSALMSVFEMADNQKQAQCLVDVNRKAARAIQKGFRYYIAKKKLFIMQNMKPKNQTQIKEKLDQIIKEKMGKTAESRFWKYINRTRQTHKEQQETMSSDKIDSHGLQEKLLKKDGHNYVDLIDQMKDIKVTEDMITELVFFMKHTKKHLVMDLNQFTAAKELNDKMRESDRVGKFQERVAEKGVNNNYDKMDQMLAMMQNLSQKVNQIQQDQILIKKTIGIE